MIVCNKAVLLGFSNETFYEDLPYEEIKEIVEKVKTNLGRFYSN